MTDYERYLADLHDLLAVGGPVAAEMKRADAAHAARQRQFNEEVERLDADRTRVEARGRDALQRATQVARSLALPVPRPVAPSETSGNDDEMLRTENDLRRALRALEDAVEHVGAVRRRDEANERDAALARRAEAARLEAERAKREQSEAERREAERLESERREAEEAARRASRRRVIKALAVTAVVALAALVLLAGVV